MLLSVIICSVILCCGCFLF